MTDTELSTYLLVGSSFALTWYLVRQGALSWLPKWRQSRQRRKLLREIQGERYRPNRRRA